MNRKARRAIVSIILCMLCGIPFAAVADEDADIEQCQSFLPSDGDVSFEDACDSFYWDNQYDKVMDGVFFMNDILVHYPSSKEEREYEIPDGIAGIHPTAFAEASHLERLVIPQSCEFIGTTDRSTNKAGVFNASTVFRSVKDFAVDRNNPYFADNEGVLFSKDHTVLLKYPPGRTDRQYSVPSGVEIIGEGAFEFSFPEKVDFPGSLRFIGDEAFYEACLQSAEFPIGLSVIGERAFYGCRLLKHVVFPETLLTIDPQAFEGCALEYVRLPAHLKSIGTYAFYGNPVEETSQVELPASLENIGEDIFRFGVSSEDYRTPVYLVHENSLGLQWAIDNGYRYRIVKYQEQEGQAHLSSKPSCALV